MSRPRIAAVVAAVLGTLVLAQGGCEPRRNLPDQPVASDAAGSMVTPEATAAPQAPAATDALVEHRGIPAAAAISTPAPSPGLAVSAAPGAPSSAVPKPSPAAAKGSPGTEPEELVAVSMAKDNRIAEVDPLTSHIIRTVDLSEPAGKMAMTPDGRVAWVFKPVGAGSTIAVLDIGTGDRREDLKFHEGDVPAAATFSTDGSRAYVATAGSIVFASSSGKEFGRIAIGPQTPGVQIPRRVSSLAVAPGRGGDVLYAADESSGVVWTLDAGSGALLNEIDVGGGPLAIATDPKRQRLYVLTDTINQVVAIDTSSDSIVNRLSLPATPLAAVVATDGRLFIAGGEAAGEVWVVSPDATAISARVPIGGRPVGVALSADGKALFIPDAAANTLNILSADTVQVLRTVTLASEPVSVVTSDRRTASASVAADSTPGPVPALVASPTQLPEDALVPDKLPAGAVAEPFVTGADVPAALAFAPDGRLFYSELHTGRIRVVQDGVLLPDPFYQFLVADQPSAGLLGLTLDPDFQNNHYLYAIYTAPRAGTGEGNANGPNELVRLTDVDNKGVDLKAVLQDLPSVGSKNAAGIRFGPDGNLYVSLADDSKGTNAQDLSTLPGKILRVNPDGSTPTDNPFSGQSGKQDAIWAYGLHVPYSFAFHPVGHQLLAFDAGAGDHDSLDLIVRGGNYGSPAAAGRPSPTIIDPIALIKPSIQPTGVTFYIGDQMPEWKDDLFFCDAVQKQLWRVRLAAQSFDRVVMAEGVKQGCSYDVATGPDGAMYYSDAQGIYRIRMPGADVLPALKVSS